MENTQRTAQVLALKALISDLEKPENIKEIANNPPEKRLKTTRKEIGTVLYLDEDIHELLRAVSKKEGRSIRQCVKRVCTAAIIGKAKLLKVYESN